MSKPIYIAVDFDGTIVKHRYPNIGDIIPGAFETLRHLQSKKVKLILWTMRSGRELHEAVQFCYDNGVEFYAVNDNPSQKGWTNSRKVYAQYYIDDAAAGCPLEFKQEDRGYVDWRELVQQCLPASLVEDLNIDF